MTSRHPTIPWRRHAGALTIAAFSSLLLSACVASDPPPVPMADGRDHQPQQVRTSAPRHQPTATDVGDGEHGRTRTARLELLDQVGRWAPVFGGVAPELLLGYDLVVVDGLPDRDGHVDTGPDSVSMLRDHGVLVLAYLSVGTIEDWRAHTADLPAEAALDAVDGWEGEHWADARVAAWTDVLVEVAARLEAGGFDGLYLDNLDVAELYPATSAAVVELVASLHERVPSLLLVAQNGLAVADDLPIDAIAHEDVFWRWDGSYRPTDPAETAALLAGLRTQQARGLPVLTLDYTEPGAAGAEAAVLRARAEGFVPAVSVLGLDRPPHAPRCTTLPP